MLEIRNKIGIKEDTTLGMDCLELAMDKEHFLNYPKEITYRYNSRGFRDNEWPEDYLTLSGALETVSRRGSDNHLRKRGRSCYRNTQARDV